MSYICRGEGGGERDVRSQVREDSTLIKGEDSPVEVGVGVDRSGIA